jgi:hypothetical protein
MSSGGQYFLYFELFFSFDDVWGRLMEIDSMFLGFIVWGEEAGVEDIMNTTLLPLGR